MREPSEYADTIVEGHNDQSFRRKPFAVIDRYGRRALRVGAAVDVHEDRTALRGGAGRRPDVQVEAVFADLAVRHELVGPRLPLGHDGLDATGRERVGEPDTRPLLRG